MPKFPGFLWHKNDKASHACTGTLIQLDSFDVSQYIWAYHVDCSVIVYWHVNVCSRDSTINQWIYFLYHAYMCIDSISFYIVIEWFLTIAIHCISNLYCIYLVKCHTFNSSCPLNFLFTNQYHANSSPIDVAITYGFINMSFNNISKEHPLMLTAIQLPKFINTHPEPRHTRYSTYCKSHFSCWKWLAEYI